VVDLTYLPFSSGPTFTFVENAGHTAGTLTIKDGATTEVLTFNGNYTPSNFALISDGSIHNGTDIVFSVIDEWTNASGGSWNTASNWSSGVPVPSTNAAIEISGTYTVTVSGTETANSLSVGDLNATLSGSGTLEINTISNAGTIIASVANQTLTITGDVTGTGTLEITNKATLELGGTCTNEVLIVNGQSTLQIDSAGTSSPFTVGDISNSIPQGEQIFLPNISFDLAADSYTETTTNGMTTGVLIVGDGHGHTVTIDVIGGVATGRTFSFSQSGSGTLAVVQSITRPAGVTGSPINLALANPSGAEGQTVPSGWSLNEGTELGNGTWTVQTTDLTALTVLTAAVYAGATLLTVTESWVNPDGSAGTATVVDNIEAYAPDSPIFALANIDTLTGAGGNDLFVFAQPISNDTIYNFNALSDKIDLVGFDKVSSFSDLQISDDTNGNAVITIGSGETITLHGVDAASLTASNFVFDQTPTLDNSGTMTISDGAELPVAGIIDNSGIIELNATGDLTELVILGDGATLEGGGRVILSGDSADRRVEPEYDLDEL
jgi:large repetitive protein